LKSEKETTSTSSCLKESEAKAWRQQDIRSRGLKFLRNVALNLCIYEGGSGKIDLALKINRKKEVAKLFREIADEIGKE
jgi:hypothetical protein